MNIIRKSSSAEMILEWLKAELVSPRFALDLKQAIQEANTDEKIITDADITSNDENKKRLSILKKYRAWFDTEVDSYDWQLVELSQNEVGNLKYIDYDYWNELSSGTRLVQEAAKNIENGVIVFDVPNDGFYSVAKSVEAGQTFPPVIVISKQDGDSEIIEGHVRATGYVLAKRTPVLLNVIYGTSK